MIIVLNNKYSLYFFGLSMMSLLVILLITLIISLVQSTDITGRLFTPTLSPYSGCEIILNANIHTTISRRDGQFTFHNVSEGVYLIEVLSTELVFPHMRLKVSEGGQVTAVELKYPGGTLRCMLPLKYVTMLMICMLPL
jgi:hypothetical protein